MTTAVVEHMMRDITLNGDGRRRLETQLVLQCAPFLKGLKVSSLIRMGKQCCGDVDQVLANTGISCQILQTGNERSLAFFYRRDEFAAYLRNKGVREMLRAYGYGCSEFCTGGVLARLAERIEEFSQGFSHEFLQGFSQGFPHEIGVFLGYPLGDVEGFIRYGGQHALLTGYWKVFTNPVEARMIFYGYDMARVCAVNQYLSGKSIREIARNCSEQHGFYMTKHKNHATINPCDLR